MEVKEAVEELKSTKIFVHLIAQSSEYSQRAIQFVRSMPGVTAALVGMSKPEHVAENLELTGIPIASGEEFRRLFH